MSLLRKIQPINHNHRLSRIMKLAQSDLLPNVPEQCLSNNETRFRRKTFRLTKKHFSPRTDTQAVTRGFLKNESFCGPERAFLLVSHTCGTASGEAAEREDQFPAAKFCEANSINDARRHSFLTPCGTHRPDTVLGE
jgi:hypothetical protein